MAYTEPVHYCHTDQHGHVADGEDDIYTTDEFRACCKQGLFIDFDGSGHPVRDNLADLNIVVKPSRLENIPPDATHIVWYNR